MEPSTTVEVVVSDDTEPREAIAVAGFPAGYCGATRRSYATDLRIFAAWCQRLTSSSFSVRRAHLKLVGRWMEETGRMHSTVAGAPVHAATFYATASRRASWSATGGQRPPAQDRLRVAHPGPRPQQLRAFLAQAGLSSARDHALASLLALNGVRISEALGVDIEDLDFERGHRTLTIVRKGASGSPTGWRRALPSPGPLPGRPRRRHPSGRRWRGRAARRRRQRPGHRRRRVSGHVPGRWRRRAVGQFGLDACAVGAFTEP